MHLGTLALLFACSLFGQQALTDGDIVKMVRSGVSEQVIIQTIQASPADYNLLPGTLDSMARNGVSDNIIKAMAARQHGVTAPVRAKDQAAAVETKATPVGNDALPRRKGPHGWDEWSLAKGRPEVFARVGGDVTTNRGGGPLWDWSIGGGGGVGINRYFAAVGEYSFTRESSTITTASLKRTTQDLIAGLRIAAYSRFSPYMIAGGGLVHRSADLRALGGVLAGSATKPAFAIGGGWNWALTPRFGLQSDVRGIKAQDFDWYGKVSGGIFFRF